MAFATVSDLEDRWRDLTPEEAQRADVLLEDAAVMLSVYSSADEGILRLVSCNMVKRAMEADGDAFGLSQIDQPPTNSAWLPSYPVGDLKPRKWELDLLKGGASIGSVPFAFLD